MKKLLCAKERRNIRRKINCCGGGAREGNNWISKSSKIGSMKGSKEGE